MNKKSLPHIAAMLVAAIILTACGDKGLNGKLNFTLADYKTVFGKAYDEALASAPPEQQNVLRERMLPVVATVVSLAENSNPATIEAFQAKKNAEEFDRIGKMSVREIVVYYLEDEQRRLNKYIQGIEELRNVKVESFSIDSVTPKDIAEYSRTLAQGVAINGTLWMRNDSNDFDLVVGCQLALVLNGKQVEKLEESCDHGGEPLRSKSGTQTYKYKRYISEQTTGKENIEMFYNFLQSGQNGKITWEFQPSKNANIHSHSDGGAVWIEAGERYFQEYKTKLQKITADLAVMKK